MTVNTLHVGDATIHLLTAGWYKTDIGVAYGIVPKSLWQTVETPDESNLIRYELRCLLVQADGLNILVDTGFGPKLAPQVRSQIFLYESPGLIESLNAVGLEAADIDLVVDTHLHWDHCGGNTEERNGTIVPAFPKARYIINRGEYEDYLRPNERTRATYFPENAVPLVEAGLVDFVEGTNDITPHVRLESAPGHTPNHCVLRVHDNASSVLFLADVVQRPVQLERIAWVPAYEIEPLRSIETKRAIVADAIAHGTTLVLQHSPAVGTLTRDEKGRTRFLNITG